MGGSPSDGGTSDGWMDAFCVPCRGCTANPRWGAKTAIWCLGTKNDEPHVTCLVLRETL